MSLTKNYNFVRDDAAFTVFHGVPPEESTPKQTVEEKRIAANRTAEAILDEKDLYNFSRAGNSSVMGTNAGDNAKKRDAIAKKNAAAQSATADTQILLSMMDDRIAELETEIQGHEDDFEAQYGDAWREMFANRILDPDDIPQRMDGESMEDYRARLEPVLMDELLDEEGEIKARYKDDPEMSKWAEWAKAQHDQQIKIRQRDTLLDPDSPQLAVDQVITEIREENDLNQNNQLDQDLAIQSQDTQAVQVAESEIEEATDEAIKSAKNEITSVDSFMSAGPLI